MKIDGACHCGQITYECEVDPDQVEICHCTDCQMLSGSAYRTVVPALRGTFQIQTGVTKTYIKTAASGSKRAQVFCPECGTPIYSGPANDPEGFVGIRLGTVRQRNSLQPRRQYWCESAQGWVNALSSIPKDARQ